MKKYVIWIIVTIILVILALGFGYYIAGGKFSIFNTKDNETDNKIEENKDNEEKEDPLKDVSFDEVKSLYNGITFVGSACSE